jgi:hypothetical protein
MSELTDRYNSIAKSETVRANIAQNYRESYKHKFGTTFQHTDEVIFECILAAGCEKTADQHEDVLEEMHSR